MRMFAYVCVCCPPPSLQIVSLFGAMHIGAYIASFRDAADHTDMLTDITDPEITGYHILKNKRGDDCWAFWIEQARRGAARPLLTAIRPAGHTVPNGGSLKAHGRGYVGVHKYECTELQLNCAANRVRVRCYSTRWRLM